MTFIFNIDGRNLAFLQRFKFSDYVIANGCLYSSNPQLVDMALALKI